MNRRRVKRFTPCNLKQTDIFTAMQNWKAIEKEKKVKKQALADIVIEIVDSDAEETKINILPKTKRVLVEPFSDDEDKNDTKGITLPLGEIEANVLRITKRKLRHTFFEDDVSDSKTECTDTTVPSKANIIHPMACSTPISSQELSTASSINSPHIGLVDILDISAIEKEAEGNKSVSDSDPTIIIPQNSGHDDTTVQISQRLVNLPPLDHGTEKNLPATEPPTNQNKIIHVRQNIIIQPALVASASNCLINASQNGSKRCLEEEKCDKKQKITHSQAICIATKDRSQNGKWLPKQDASNSSTVKSNVSQQKRIKKSDISTGCEENGNAEGESSATNDNLAAKQSTSKNGPDNNNKRKCDDDLKKSNGQEKRRTPEKKPNDPVTKTSPDPNDKSLPSTSTPHKMIGQKTSNIPLASPVKSPDTKKEKKMNKEALQLITTLFQKVFSSRLVGNISEAERTTIRTFLDMNVSHQYVCFKLITWKKKWYNAYKFCRLIHLDLEETEIADMVNVLERHGIIDTNYTRESPMQLLPRLDNTDLRAICDNFRLKKTLKTKEDMIRNLLKYSTSQTTLSVVKTTRDLLLDQIQFKMGRSMRVSEHFFDAFHSVYLLGTFTNPNFVTINEYLNKILGQKVVFPQFSIDEYVVFSSRSDFLRFAKARRYRNDLEELKDPLECLQICKTIFKELRALEDIECDDGRFDNAPHLVRFTAKAVYVSALSSMSKKLFCKFPREVRVWLEYLIRKVGWPHKIGRWYFHLVWLYMRYLQPLDYNRAAELLVEVLHRKRHHLSEVQLYHLRKRGEQLFATKKYKIDQMRHDLIAELLPEKIRIRNIPECTIEAKTIRSNDLGTKRNYEIRDRSGNKTYLQVEEIALNHYLSRLGYTGGQHCEGALVKATFTLFFFDIIYSKAKSIPGTFISDLQSEPLDMNSRHFYPNRKEEIDRRVQEIESRWSDDGLLKFLKASYEAHSHEFALCEVGHIIPDAWLLDVLVECVGRKVLAKIYERLALNFRENRSGLPDLLVWNVDTKQCKFVEVKGENDKLSVGQTLWLDYLRRIGANVEVCHVHSIGSKRKVKKVAGIDEQPSTSSSSSG